MDSRRDPPGRRLLKGKTCLIVDDDPVFCELAAACIRREMGRPVVRDGGVEALEYLDQRPCDLAVIDLIMPNIDGFRLISIVRHMPNFRHLPIAIATSRLDDLAKVEAQRLGIECFLTKPLYWPDFTARLAAMLREADAKTGLHLQPKIA